MKKYLTIMLAMVFGIGMVQANPVSESTAKYVGQQFVQANFEQSRQSEDLTLVYTGTTNSDEWGETGFVYPTLSIKESKVSFTCVVTTYDENWNPVSSEQNITGYTLLWGYGKGKTKELTPDENGVCTIPAYYYTNGEHALQIVKNADNGLPTVMRYAPDFTVTVEDADMGFFARFLAFFEMVFTTIRDFFASMAK